SYTVLQQAAGSNMDLEQQLKATKEEIEKISYQLHGDMAGLPEKQMESYIIGRLQKVSWDTGVELASVIPGHGKQVQMFQETLFKVQINATYFNFIDWLQTINQELGYIVVKKFDIHPKTGKVTANPSLNFSLTLVSYRMVRNG
ncbi:MAG: type 4a pilus biogenesis protein PilO, partial [Thiotrichaceae bacterium]|nr:type 4a pilus biogenesis protein PilO [Thiotrichaceae bacterium]